MRIAMVGSGYVGLVSAACFADFGHTVVCVDKDEGKIAGLRDGRVPIFEPGLANMVKSNAAEGRLVFTTSLAEAMAEAAIVFIAVGTPTLRGDGHADLSYVYAAAREIAGLISGFTVIVTKSTVPVGTGEEVERIIREARPDAEFAVVSNPEFLREGAAIGDFKRPDRIIIGTSDERARAVMEEVYRPLHLNEGPLVFMGRRDAELTKYAGNAFLAMKITFINEMADLAEAVGANVQAVARGIGLDKRIGAKFLNPGPGYGGSCFPKDTLALVKTARDAGRPVRLIETVVDINDQRKAAMVDKIVAASGGSVAGKRIAILGLAFKPNTDDMRDAPALVIVPKLKTLGADVVAFDPEAHEQAERLMPGLAFAKGPYDCIAGADAVVIVTEWDAFRALDLARVRSLVRTPVMVDLRNIYRVEQVRAHGFAYSSIGRPDHPGG
ncbi:MAG TPA: UDP-glucose/GDP-mannose dehydrogenase family protein [Beijerinckiaceae bacterium]|nr:UDP-glucose/GDP-mannose dehydrogenase family protein [Beijerinckiaceae bacterium]